MKSIKLLGVIFIIMVSVMGCEKKKEILKMTEEETSWERPLIDKMLCSEADGNFCILRMGEGEPVIIPDLYFVKATAYIGTTYTIEDKSYRIEETDRYEIGVYDIQTLEKIKTIDMKEIMSPYMQDWQIYGLGFWVGEYNNKYYITQTLSRKQTEEEIIADTEMEFRELWIDIEDETAGWVDKEPNRVRADNNENVWMLVGTLILDVNGYEDVNVYNHGVLEDTSYIVIPTSKLPEKNEKLYGLFPELKNVSREEGLYAHIYLHPQTDNMEAISLILNDGERLDFDALKPDSDGHYGTYGKNGELHRITKEEYEQFRKDYEAYFDKGR